MSKESAPIRFVVSLSFLLLCLPSFAQDTDWHETSLDLFAKSPFAHGYMHGYEDGFHTGDLDMQMGRNFRDVKYHEQYKRTAGYKPSYGDKSSYEGGYRSGYLVGYTDSYSGRSFRAAAWLRQTNRAAVAAHTQWDFKVDAAFKQGYLSGQRQGLHDGRTAGAENASVQCSEQALQAKGDSPEPQSDYCEAYRSGYQLGYSDGFANQSRYAPVIARK